MSLKYSPVCDFGKKIIPFSLFSDIMKNFPD